MPDVPDDYWLRRAGVLTEEDDAGWIPHDGGSCPVPSGTHVVLRRQDGKELAGPAGRFGWQWGVELCEDCDIAAYRVLDSEQPASPKPTPPNAHYRQGDIECIDAIRAALTDEEWRGYCKGNVLKYVWREKHKGGNETLVMAQDYLRWAVAGKAEGKR